jgi:uncharacterized protein YidB (DUF937 family)
MTALLALLAVAGYQNRDRLSAMLRNAQAGAGGQAGGAGGSAGGGLGGMLGNLMGGGQPQAGTGGGMAGGLGGLLGGLLGGGGGQQGGLGSLLGGGLRDLDGRFREAGRGEVMESWVGRGPNRPLNAPDLEAALGPETMAELQQTTGLSRDELLERLTRTLPEAVDGYTPEGRLPREDEWG